MGKKTFNKQIILDLGCGEYKINDKAYGVDIRRTSSVNVVCNIKSNLPFKYESVDIVYCRHVLEHIGDLETLLKEITRILKRDGKIVIIGLLCGGRKNCKSHSGIIGSDFSNSLPLH